MLLATSATCSPGWTLHPCLSPACSSSSALAHLGLALTLLVVLAHHESFAYRYFSFLSTFQLRNLPTKVSTDIANPFSPQLHLKSCSQIWNYATTLLYLLDTEKWLLHIHNFPYLCLWSTSDVTVTELTQLESRRARLTKLRCTSWQKLFGLY